LTMSDGHAPERRATPRPAHNLPPLEPLTVGAGAAGDVRAFGGLRGAPATRVADPQSCSRRYGTGALDLSPITRPSDRG
jgi:hypothetical protein